MLVAHLVAARPHLPESFVVQSSASKTSKGTFQLHRHLKELLPTAKGESHTAVVVFLDIRGFSSFAKIAESADAALYLRSIYIRILDSYFPESSFFKPTGDGLLIIFNYEDVEQLTKTVNNAIDASLRLIQDFSTLTSEDPMINFDVPSDLGIGLARGSATALISDDQVLDYSGRPLNLAARLMDLARPRGVVFDRSLGWTLLNEDYKKEFVAEQVYIKGIAEDSSVLVYVMANEVRLPDASKRPIRKYEWKTTKQEEIPLSKLRERGIYFHDLPEEPALRDNIRVHISHPSVGASGRKNDSLWTFNTYPATYEQQQGTHFAKIDFNRIARDLLKSGVKRTWNIRVVVEYAVDAES